MKALAFLVVLVATPALSEPAFYEALDFKNCLHWNIDNEMHGADLGKERKQYVTALNLANRQRYSGHKLMPTREFDDVYRQHFAEVAIVYSASAFDTKNKRRVERYGVCNHEGGLTCLPNQDFPLAGATYSTTRSKGPLETLICVSGCLNAPAMIHDMGYENMGGERNVEREATLKKYVEKCGREP